VRGPVHVRLEEFCESVISLQIEDAGIRNDVASDNDENKFMMAAI